MSGGRCHSSVSRWQMLSTCKCTAEALLLAQNGTKERRHLFKKGFSVTSHPCEKLYDYRSRSAF